MPAPQYRLAVRFYRGANGREPVRDWLAALPRSEKKVVGEDIKTVQLGWPLGMPLVRKLENGLWEVRITIAGGIVRVLFTITGHEMVLLHGVIKKSQKLPGSDLDLARRRMKEIQHGQ